MRDRKEKWSNRGKPGENEPGEEGREDRRRGERGTDGEGEGHRGKEREREGR